jgi:hypothetical protein
MCPLWGLSQQEEPLRETRGRDQLQRQSFQAGAAQVLATSGARRGRQGAIGVAEQLIGHPKMALKQFTVI